MGDMRHKRALRLAPSQRWWRDRALRRPFECLQHQYMYILARRVESEENVKVCAELFLNLRHRSKESCKQRGLAVNLKSILLPFFARLP